MLSRRIISCGMQRRLARLIRIISMRQSVIIIACLISVQVSVAVRCLPAGPCVTDEDVRYVVECIKEAIVK